MNKAIAHYKLSRMLGQTTYQDACEQECRNAYLQGILDQLFEDRRITIKQYYEGKEWIKALGEDRFAEEFKQRFGKSVPVNAHLCE